jgi:cell shape-determining protein MreC
MGIEWTELILKHLASWPVAIVIVALLFRRFLLDFLKDVTKAKFGPVEFERRLEEVQKNTEALKEFNRLLLENEQLKLQLSQQELEGKTTDEKRETIRRIAESILEMTRFVGGVF